MDVRAHTVASLIIIFCCAMAGSLPGACLSVAVKEAIVCARLGIDHTAQTRVQPGPVIGEDDFRLHHTSHLSA